MVPDRGYGQRAAMLRLVDDHAADTASSRRVYYPSTHGVVHLLLVTYCP